MKQILSTLCLSMVLALAASGCAGGREDMPTPSVSPLPTQESGTIPSSTPRPDTSEHPVKGAADSVGDAAKNALDGARDVVRGAADGAGDMIRGAANGVGNAARDIGNGVKRAVR